MGSRSLVWLSDFCLCIILICLLSHLKEKKGGAEETPQLAGEFATGEDHCPLSALLDLGSRVFTAQLRHIFLTPQFPYEAE